MKEQTYGWYPSQQDVYKPKGQPNSYHVDCLYRYRSSTYYSPPIPPPQPSLMVRGYGQFEQSNSDVRPKSACSSTAKKTGHIGKNSGRVKSAPPVPRFTQVPKLKIPTLMQCWQTYVPETEYTQFSSTNGYTPHPPKHSRATSSPQVSWPLPKTVDRGLGGSNSSQNIAVDKDSSLSNRVKSATIRRERSKVPVRPIFSAGSRRPSAPVPPEDTPIVLQDGEKNEEREAESDEDVPEEELYHPALSVDVEPTDPCPSPPRATTPESQYEEMREKFGWRAEVHGDPYKLKKTFKRLPYTVKVAEPEVPPEPPRIHMENFDTFFYNTIPRRHATFAIQKEWISEVIHAKRMELQKRESIKYRWKNFGFVY